MFNEVYQPSEELVDSYAFQVSELEIDNYLRRVDSKVSRDRARIEIAECLAFNKVNGL